MASLELVDVSKRYGRTEAVRNVSLSVGDGEFLVLVGPSGCGKSTLLNLIAGLEHASSGEIRIDARRVNEVHPKDRDIAMVFQSYALYPNMNVERNITFGLRARGVPKAQRDTALRKVASLLQIEPLLERKPAELSGGQRQRVAMGRAMVRDPSIFLFDEPLSNLDAKLRLEMRTEIKRLHQRLGTSAVYVTHDQIEAMTLATRIAVMRDGVLQQCADPRTVFESPANLFVADFIGSPSMNFVPATLVQQDGSLGVHLPRQGDAALYVPLPQAPARYADWLGRDVVFGVRPEHLAALRPGEPALPARAVLECRVDVVEPTGTDTMVFFPLGAVEMVARIDAQAAVRPGELLRLAIDAARTSLFDPRTGQRI
ncbi:ABC transporter ATP-binding protein [Piscinibacter defluvii]|uniref:ABC transporter ATP-binding protein n=1 Tax=Piscinibacter defluvii TaxID=1796922 RepID=UPI000FDDD8E7|nr:sn-glycerol-3-phosphate ABC transporter ATP-binding protein UgpC [Piscinibacter defluvii]